MVKVRCQCGIEKIVGLGNLRPGQTVSCGCHHRESTAKRFSTLGDTPWIVEDRGHKTPCYTYTGATNEKDYGVIRVGRKQVRAHRFFYEKENGPIPDGLIIDHLCRNRDCVRPDHLEPVTNQENIRRGHRARGVARV